MNEFLTFLVGAGVLAAVGAGGFLAGRDAAERRSGETIANLRRAVMGLRARCDRLEERNNRLAAALEAATPRDPDAPRWLTRG